jgi:amino acid transporter
MTESSQASSGVRDGEGPKDDRQLSGHLGTTSLVLSVLAFSAPLVTTAGYMVFVIGPVGKTAPVAWIAAMIALWLFSVGYTTMTRYVPRPGAFYAYISLALGRVFGVGAAYLASLAYVVIGAGVYVFAGVTLSSLYASLSGHQIAWWICSLAVFVLINLLGYRNIDVSAKVLVVIMSLEVFIVVVFDLMTLVRGGAEGLSAAPLNPVEFVNPGAGVALLVAFGTFLGFEATALYRDEVRDPDRTVPRGTYIAVIFIGILYAATCYFLIASYGTSAIDKGGELPSDMFAIGIDRFVFHGSSTIVNVVVATSAIASILAIHNVATRYMHNLGVDRAAPSMLGVVHPSHKSPSRASLSIGAITAVVLIPFALGGVDPGVLIGGASGLGSAGVLLLMAVVSLSVILWFRRSGIPPRENRWRTQIAPLLAFLILGAVVTFGIVRFDLLAGGTPGQYSWLLLVLVGIFAAGCAVALHLRRSKPEVFELLGRRDRDIVDPDTVA